MVEIDPLTPAPNALRKVPYYSTDLGKYSSEIASFHEVFYFE